MLQTMTMIAPGKGLADPVMDGQSVFRTVMAALAEPGIIRALDPNVLGNLGAPTALSPATAAMLLALADFETPLWLDRPLAAPEIASYLRFHAGCPIVDDPKTAHFAVIADGATLGSLDSFALGSLEYPDRSATLIVQVMSLTNGALWKLAGPGIASIREVHISSVHHALAALLSANRALFPCGVDVLFTDGASVLALPRSTIVTEG